MSLLNRNRSGCKDVFKSFLLKNAKYDGIFEIPTIEYGIFRPKKLILFSKCLSSIDYEAWVCFYEDDAAFERVWNNPRKYLPILKKFAGVICPDFSLYRDMPLAYQLWNVFRSRMLGSWFQANGINVIANVRFSDPRSYTFVCAGVAQGGTIAVGSHGCIKCKQDKEEFAKGLDYVVNELKPTIIIVYGTAPDDIFGKYKELGIEILQFDSEFATSRKENQYGGR